ncbi:hypothetical protein V8D89_003873 [Ganoderma adspersum]
MTCPYIRNQNSYRSKLPTIRPGGLGYSDPSTWVWVPCLEFPVDRVNELQFSSKPLKWIRYCIGAVTGTQGHLSHKADSLDVVDYDQPLSSDSASMALYYHVSDAERELMFPTDPHLADRPKTSSVHSFAATTTSSVACEGFHQDLRDRDTRCLITASDEVFCDAIHLVPHCRDDEYIRTLTTRRCRGREDDIVSSIDDVRNGLLLRASFHRLLRQTLAFMPVPNFAMDSTDAVPPSADPSERMYVVHPFLPLESFKIAGSRLAMPSPSSNSRSNWPPQVLFEVVYGATVLHEFGVPDVHARVAAIWDELYYPRGGFDATAAKMCVQRRRARVRRNVARGPPRPDGFDLLMLIPYLGVPEDELREYFAEGARRAEEEKRKGAEEKVNGWRADVVSRM